MREIKFRVWNTDSKEWVSNEKEQSQTKLDYNTNYLVKWHVYELEQFTGLKDKNGKEIYEGDILTEGLEVVYNNGSFKTTYENDQQGGAFLTKKRCKYLEIIGNIHER